VCRARRNGIPNEEESSSGKEKCQKVRLRERPQRFRCQGLKGRSLPGRSVLEKQKEKAANGARKKKKMKELLPSKGESPF